MNTYSKVLITTLPLVFLLLLSTVGIAYHFSRTAELFKVNAQLRQEIQEREKMSRENM